MTENFCFRSSKTPRIFRGFSNQLIVGKSNSIKWGVHIGAAETLIKGKLLPALKLLSAEKGQWKDSFEEERENQRRLAGWGWKK